ncbi:MAG: carboxylesterase [Gammaproteobacteria bacterium]|nr:carboxylesterase [Gammaproteobacteria bacterium]
MTPDLETLVVVTGENPVGTVIWMHGLGADAHDFEPVVPMLKLDRPLRFVFPNAPVRPVTINGGMEMRAWYDIDLSNPTVGERDIRESAAAIDKLIDAEVAGGMPARRITLAGFSQGGVIATYLGVRANRTLAGIMGLSTYIHNHERVVDEVSLDNIDTPIFMAHGIADPMIPIARAITGREALRRLNYQVEWHEYGMGHQVSPQEINDIAAWLNRIYGG